MNDQQRIDLINTFIEVINRNKNNTMKFINIQGDLYDYKKQRWIKIDTLTDKRLSEFRFITPSNVNYLINPNDITEYRYTN